MAEQVSLQGTEVHRLRSDLIGQDYLVNIALPPGYDPNGDDYPVVYVTDGGPAFTGLNSVVPLMQMFGQLTPFITVGITHDTKEPMHSLALRNRDLTHCSGELPMSDDVPDWFKELPKVDPGGAGNFLEFINEDVKTHIQKSFNAGSDSAYAGYSLGGLFGLFALFTKPESFQRYVIGSPSIWWGDRDILSLEAAYAESHDDLDASVFMSSGRLEEPVDAPDDSSMVTNMLNLAQALTDRGYKSLKLSHTVFDEETHLSGHPLALLRGIRTVFS